MLDTAETRLLRSLGGAAERKMSRLSCWRPDEEDDELFRFVFVALDLGASVCFFFECRSRPFSMTLLLLLIALLFAVTVMAVAPLLLW